MTNEEMQKAMDFILEQEARSSAKIDALGEKVDALADVQKHADERWARADERWARTEESIRALLSIAEMHEKEIVTLTENGRATDERLNALINVVERQISEGRNGKS
jgi:Mg2+ and Co2+ transporter CorA